MKKEKEKRATELGDAQNARIICKTNRFRAHGGFARFVRPYSSGFVYFWKHLFLAYKTRQSLIWCAAAAAGQWYFLCACFFVCSSKIRVSLVARFFLLLLFFFLGRVCDLLGGARPYRDVSDAATGVRVCVACRTYTNTQHTIPARYRAPRYRLWHDTIWKAMTPWRHHKCML